MKTLIRVMAISMLMVFAAPVYSETIQIFNCTYEGDATEDDVMNMASKWLKAAKTLKGGENLQIAIRHPVAAAVSEFDFKFVIITPNFAEWGAFTDAYDTSVLVEIDDELFKIANCGESSLWEGGMVE
ncbi:MAG: hypothetical protein WBN41_06135 [Lysobacterales bacterium]